MITTITTTRNRQRPAWAVDLILELNGEWEDQQTVGGVKDPNSGGI
jgi:hypothetical protein